MNAEQHHNAGNNYGKNNKGKQYNKVRTKTNGKYSDSESPIVKVIVHTNVNNTITSVAVYYSDGNVSDSNTLPKRIKTIISKWHKKTTDYYRGAEYVMSDTIYSCYFEGDTFIKRQMRVLQWVGE